MTQHVILWDGSDAETTRLARLGQGDTVRVTEPQVTRLIAHLGRQARRIVIRWVRSEILARYPDASLPGVDGLDLIGGDCACLDCGLPRKHEYRHRPDWWVVDRTTREILVVVEVKRFAATNGHPYYCEGKWGDQLTCYGVCPHAVPARYRVWVAPAHRLDLHRRTIETDPWYVDECLDDWVFASLDDLIAFLASTVTGAMPGTQDWLAEVTLALRAMYAWTGVAPQQLPLVGVVRDVGRLH